MRSIRLPAGCVGNQGRATFNNQEQNSWLTLLEGEMQKGSPAGEIDPFLPAGCVGNQGRATFNNQEQNSWLTLLEGEMQKGSPGR